ncbi:MAG: hypothetical protein VYA69_07065 [Gemmatimonadota bacterium]|nr:hypothetical protein [Gemmatimonadota bacterium]
MPMIQEKDRQVIRERLQAMGDPATLVFFSQANDPPEHSEEMLAVMNELTDLSDHLSVTVYDFQTDADRVEQYGVERMPAIVVEGKKDYGVRYYGFPFGHEFPAFIDDIIDVSTGESGLSADTQERLSSLATPVHLRVFSTPT